MKKYIQKLLREGIEEDTITKVIYKMREFYAEQDCPMTPREINTGECRNFAESVYFELNKLGIEVEILCDADFDDPYDDVDNQEFLLDPRDYGSEPTYDYKELGIDAHSWVYYNGKHYDSETPEGVRNFFDLPTLQLIKQSRGIPRFR